MVTLHNVPDIPLFPAVMFDWRTALEFLLWLNTWWIIYVSAWQKRFWVRLEFNLNDFTGSSHSDEDVLCWMLVCVSSPQINPVYKSIKYKTWRKQIRQICRLQITGLIIEVFVCLCVSVCFNSICVYMFVFQVPAELNTSCQTLVTLLRVCTR